MPTPSPRRGSRAIGVVGVLLPLLLAVHFSSSVVLASLALPAPPLAFLSNLFEGYGVVLAFGLVGSIALLLRVDVSATYRVLGYVVLAIQLATLAWWLATASSAVPPSMTASFPIFAAIATAGTAASCLVLFGPSPALASEGTKWAHLVLLALVPLVFALRVATSLGVGTAPGPGGTLQGSWLLVNAPTILLEYFAIGMWLSLLWEPAARGLRSRLDVWLPLVALAPVILGLAVSSLFAFIFSAFITWGTNLAVFVPATVSMSLAAASVACYISFFLVLRGIGSRRWKPLFLATATILLSGFFPSAVSVAGLSFGMLSTTAALAARETVDPS